MFFNLEIRVKYQLWREGVQRYLFISSLGPCVQFFTNKLFLDSFAAFVKHKEMLQNSKEHVAPCNKPKWEKLTVWNPYGT